MAGLDDASSALASTFANAVLSLSPDRRERLRALEGRVLRLEAPPLPTAVTLIIEDAQFRVADTQTTQPHVIVRGQPHELLALLLEAPAAFRQNVAIEGDDTLLVELREVLSGPAGGSSAGAGATPLAQLLGEDSARGILGAAELALATLRSAAQAAGGTVTDLAAEHYPTRAAGNAFLDDLDDLRLRVDRLAARVRVAEMSRSKPP